MVEFSDTQLNALLHSTEDCRTEMHDLIAQVRDLIVLT
jgi:hypothetical protein